MKNAAELMAKDPVDTLTGELSFVVFCSSSVAAAVLEKGGKYRCF